MAEKKKNAKKMKILFVLSHPGFLRHYADTVERLAARGHSIHIGINAYDSQMKKLHLSQASSMMDQLHGLAEKNRRIKIISAPNRRDVWTFVALAVREAMDYFRFLDPFFDDSPKLKERSERRLPAFFRLLLKLIAGRKTDRNKVNKLIRVLTRIEEFIPCSRKVIAFIRAIDPDIVLVTPLIEFGSSQVDYIKAAKWLGIPNALCVASWDNLTNKGLIRIEPDRVIVWNRFQREEAVALHGIPFSKVIITGAQTFDEWFTRKSLVSREDFCKRRGLRCDRPYILYLCSSPFITPHEVRFVVDWIQHIRQADDRDLHDLGVLIRPHPVHAMQWENVELSEYHNVTVWPKTGAIPVDEDTKKDFFDSIYHAIAIMGINTSGMIEAGIIGRPVFTMKTPEFAETQSGTIHFRYLLAGGLLHIADNYKDHFLQISTMVNNGDTAKERLKNFIFEFIRPHGLEFPCSPILADAIEEVKMIESSIPKKKLSNYLLRVGVFPLVLLTYPLFHARFLWKWRAKKAKSSIASIGKR